MCLSAPRRHPPPARKGKSPPSSFSSLGSSAGSDPPPSPRKHRRKGSITTSTSSDLPIRVAKVPPGQPLPTRAPLPVRRSSTKKSSRSGSVNGNTNGSTAGGPISSLPPSRRSSTRGRGSSRLAPASPMVGPGGRSPAMSTRSAMNTPTPSPTKRALSQHRSSSRSKYLGTPGSQRSSSTSTPLPSPRIPREKRGKDKSKGDMDIKPGDRVIAARVPMEGGGSVAGLMVVRPGSSRRGSDNGSHKSKSSKGSEAGEILPKKSAKIMAAPPAPIGLGITMDSPMPPPSKVVERRSRESEVQARPATLSVPRISVDAPPAPVVTQPVKKAQAVPVQQPPTVGPAPPASTTSARTAAPAKYPILATMSYPTQDQLAYKPVDRSQIPTTNFPGKVTVASVLTPIMASAPVKASQKTRAPVVAVAPPTKPPPASKVPPSQPPVARPPVSLPLPAAKPQPPPAPIERPASIASSISSRTTATSSSLSASSTASEKPTPRQITYSPHPVSSPSSSSSSLASISSSGSSSTTTSSAHPRRIPSSEPIVPEMSSRKPAYYRYAPKKDTSQKRIMDSPAFPQDEEAAKPRKPAGPWDGRPGADPNLGVYYRTAEAEKLRQSKSHLPSEETWVDEANLANYYKQADAQKRRMALEKMKKEQECSDGESTVSSSAVSSTPSSEAWVDPNVAAYYRHAESEKERKKQLDPQTPKKQQPVPRPRDEKALRIYSSPPTPAISSHHPSPNIRLRHVRGGLPSHPIPPPAPTPPPPDTTDTETLGETPTEKKPGPPEGAAEAWFQASMAAKGESASDYWNASRSTIESPEEEVGGEKVEFPEGLPPAPTPPLSREDTPAGAAGDGSYYSTTGGYRKEKKKGYRR